MTTAGAGALVRYRVLRPLGPTRFGHAQLALLEGEGRSRGFFALELLREDWAKDEELRSSFLEEAARTLHFEHPNVVRTQEVLAEPEVCGRVTRWFAGQSLAAVLDRVGRAHFPLQLHVRVLCEVLAAVQYLHELEQAAGGRLLYRDTAPAHVLVTYTGQIKIVGAGFERTIEEIERRSGALFSDVDYASPELCLGYPAAPSADVYSVGVMLWEALARAPRVFADNPEAKVRMRINGEEPDVDQFRREVPARLAQLCRRALAVSPRDRYGSAQELQIDLESFLADTETDAQQNAGLGALAELMAQHFAAERAEMLGYIEQHLAEAEPASAPASSRAAAGAAAPGSDASASADGAASVAAASTASTAPAASSPPRPRAPRLEMVALEDLEQESEQEGPEELSHPLEPARWDEHTHTVTSFEELGPVLGPVQPAPDSLPPSSSAPFSSLPPSSLEPPVAAPEPALLQELAAEWAEAQPSGVPIADVPPVPVPPPLQLPVREPDTSGHRAYSTTVSSTISSTLRPALGPPRDWLRTAAPVGLAAALVLLLGYGIRVARSSSADSAASARGGLELAGEAQAAVSSAELQLQGGSTGSEGIQTVHPSALAVVGAAQPAQVVAAPPSEVPASAELASDDGSEPIAPDAIAPDIVEQIDGPGDPQSGEAASPPAVVPAVPAAAEPLSEPELAAAPDEPPPEASPAEPASLEPEPLRVEQLSRGEERRPAPRARRSRARAGEGRGARVSVPPPRAIDETDPDLE